MSNLTAVAYDGGVWHGYPDNYHHRYLIRLRSIPGDALEKWAVENGLGETLDVDCIWVDEPNNSDRTDEYLLRNRYSSAQAAAEQLQRWKNNASP